MGFLTSFGRHLLITLLINSLALVWSGAFAQQSSQDPRFTNLDQLINRALNEFHIAGCAVAVVEKNKLIYAKGFGFRDYQNKLPVTANTVFPIASCTKAFTAALWGILAQQYHIDLDKPLREYFPQLRFYDDYTTEHVTLRDLLAHRTGLPRHDKLVDFFDPKASTDSLLYRIRFLEPSAELRQRAQYTNLMYVILGILAEKLTGTSWQQSIQANLLTPLGMANTSFQVSELDRNPDHSLGYYVHTNKILPGHHEVAELNGPAGGINSSVTDMANWLITWLNGGRYKEKQVIPADFVRQATSPQMVNGNTTYGLGWLNSSFRGAYQSAGYTKISHGGDLPLYSSSVSFFPYRDSLGIVVLSNQFGGYITNLVSDYLADVLLGGKQAGFKATDWFTAYQQLYQANNPQTVSSPADKQPARTASLSHSKQAYIGTYYHPGYGRLTISLQGDTLTGRFNGNPVSLRHQTYDVFEAEPAGRLHFTLNNEGQIDAIAMPLEERVKDIIFLKQQLH